jgi:hypothetical protein
MSSTTTQQGPQETRVFNPPEAFVAQATVSGMDGYNALCAEAEARRSVLRRRGDADCRQEQREMLS